MFYDALSTEIQLILILEIFLVFYKIMERYHLKTALLTLKLKLFVLFDTSLEKIITVISKLCTFYIFLQHTRVWGIIWVIKNIKNEQLNNTQKNRLVETKNSPLELGLLYL